MPYIRREEGKITGCYAQLQPGVAEEYLDDDDVEVIALLSQSIVSGNDVSISDRQFFQQLANQGLITQAEALAAVQTGTIPAAMTTFIDQLPEDQRFGARMVLCGATTFERGNPLVSAFGAMQGMNAAQIDDLWTKASLL